MAVPQAPNTGRILDFWLGGNHHFEPDAAAGRAFDSLFDGFPEVFGTLRAFIGRAVRAAEDEGVSQFLVLGAGIPAQGNVHEAVPACRVLYTDIDRANIEIGKEILRDVPDTDYTYCDAADLGSLDRDVAAATIDLSERLGIVVVGVNVFLDDDAVRRTLADLHDLAPAGSVLVADFDGEALESYPEVLRILDEAGEPLHLRRPPRIRPLLGRWELTEDDIQPVGLWRDTGPARPGPTFMYGCMARKPA